MSPLLKRKPEPAKPQTPAEARRARQEREEKATLTEPIRVVRQRVDLDAITMDEAREMYDLHEKARDRQPDGAAREGLEALSPKEQARFLELLDNALPKAERERQKAIGAERKRRALENFANEIASEGVPPQRRLGLRAGEILLPPDVVDLGTLRVFDVGVLVHVIHGWTSGVVPFRDARWSDDGSALLLPQRIQLVSEVANRMYDSDGLRVAAVNLGNVLQHLDANDFLQVERDPGGWTIRLGPRMRGYLESAA